MPTTTESVADALTTADIPVDAVEVGALARHLDMVIAANTTMNLTSVSDPERAAWVHVVDSLLPLDYVTRAPGGPLCDLGSGAGYPGIPLAIVCGRHTVLVESTSKKAAFLATVVDDLGLDAQVLSQRGEKVGAERAGEFAVVTARALSSLPSVVELAAPLLLTGGRLVAYRGVHDESELARGDRAAELVGLERTETGTALLIGSDDAQRTFVVYERRGRLKMALPRREGLAQHAPLA